MTRVSKEKQEATIEKMKDRREVDSIHLRSIVEKKLEWASSEKKKGTELVARYEKELETLRKQIIQLDGSIIALTQVLQESVVKEKVKEEKADAKPEN